MNWKFWESKPVVTNALGEVVKPKQKNISEPVLSFIECVRKTPQRFDVSGFSYDSCRRERYTYYVRDKVTGEKWSISNELSIDCYTHFSDTSWLTYDEIQYLITEITAIYKAREGRKMRLEKIRKDRKDAQERKRLISIYCKE